MAILFRIYCWWKEEIRLTSWFLVNFPLFNLFTIYKAENTCWVVLFGISEPSTGTLEFWLFLNTPELDFVPTFPIDSFTLIPGLWCTVHHHWQYCQWHSAFGVPGDTGPGFYGWFFVLSVKLGGFLGEGDLDVFDFFLVNKYVCWVFLTFSAICFRGCFFLQGLPFWFALRRGCGGCCCCCCCCCCFGTKAKLKRFFIFSDFYVVPKSAWFMIIIPCIREHENETCTCCFYPVDVFFCICIMFFSHSHSLTFLLCFN